MKAHQLISGFEDLTRAVVAARSKNRLAREMGQDKNTINRWLEGTRPAADGDVAEMVRPALEVRPAFEDGIDVGPFQTTPLVSSPSGGVLSGGLASRLERA
jgi:hypothetical protein